jgi:hypothetical protein
MAEWDEFVSSRTAAGAGNRRRSAAPEPARSELDAIEVRTDLATGRNYYFNRRTGKTSWRLLEAQESSAHDCAALVPEQLLRRKRRVRCFTVLGGGRRKTTVLEVEDFESFTEDRAPSWTDFIETAKTKLLGPRNAVVVLLDQYDTEVRGWDCMRALEDGEELELAEKDPGVGTQQLYNASGHFIRDSKMLDTHMMNKSQVQEKLLLQTTGRAGAGGSGLGGLLRDTLHELRSSQRQPRAYHNLPCRHSSAWNRSVSGAGTSVLSLRKGQGVCSVQFDSTALLLGAVAQCVDPIIISPPTV